MTSDIQRFSFDVEAGRSYRLALRTEENDRKSTADGRSTTITGQWRVELVEEYSQEVKDTWLSRRGESFDLRTGE